MTTSVQRRRGSTVQHSTFTGLEGEITVDTNKDTAVVHDGSTIGGFPLAKEGLENTNTSNLNAITGADTAADDTFLIYDTSASAMKRITRAELNNAIEKEPLSNVTINSGSIDGTTIGSTTASSGKFTTLYASSTVSGTGFSNYFASPPALGGTAAAAVSSTNLSYTGTLTGGTGVINIGSGQIYKDASGNLGIGTTPAAWVNGVTGVSGATLQGNSWGIAAYGGFDSTDFATNAYASTYASNYKYRVSAAATLYRQNGMQHQFFSANAGTAAGAITWLERMRITSGGSLLIGQTADNARVCITFTGGASQNGLRLNTADAGTSTAVQFVYNAVNQVGTITTTTAATAYNTTSDYRLKENVEPMTGALAKVAELKPVTYTWKVNGSDGQGFIAHELQAVVPDCVTGEKDAVDAEGNPVYQGIDTSFLVATLTKAIQELNAKVDAQAAEITFLKGK